MKAMIIEAYGSADLFKTAELPVPVLRENEVLLEVRAVSINPFDCKIRAGLAKDYLPYTFPIILGWDVSGVVKAIGVQTSAFQIGDEVFARVGIKKPGGLAEYCAVEEHLLVKKPENLSFEQAAAIPLAAMTAWQMLVDKAGIRKGELVLIQGGAGGVGSFAVQLAGHFGAAVTATASGKNVELVRSLGADRVIDYQKEDFTECGSKFDVILDTVGGHVLTRSYDLLKPGGRLVSIAGRIDNEIAVEKKITALYFSSTTKVEQLREIGTMVSEGSVKTLIAAIFPFTAKGVRNAHLLSESGHAGGKIVVKVG